MPIVCWHLRDTCLSFLREPSSHPSCSAIPVFAPDSKSATARYALAPSANAWDRFSFLLVCVACAFSSCPGIKIARRISSQYVDRFVVYGLLAAVTLVDY